jgi:hypothetical protein
MSDLRRYEILVPLLFNDGRQKLKARFEQLDIWITSYPLDVI